MHNRYLTVKSAISYIRYSTPKQRQGDSYRRQIKAAKDYCEINGLELDLTILDDGVSGFTGRNARQGALANLLQDIDSGRIPSDVTIIIESLDRLTRMEVERAMNLLLSIVERGVTIVTLMDGQEYRSGQMDMIRLMTSLVYMSRAHEESATKSRRLSAVWDKKRDEMREGKHHCPRLPDWVDKDYQLIPEKAESVRRLFAYLADGLGSAAAMRRLNGEGCYAPSGKPWALTSIKRLIESQIVLGHYQPYLKKDGKRVPAGDSIEGYYPQVIEPELYWKVKNMKRENKGSNGIKKGKVSNLFSRLVFCEHCGATCRYVNKGKRADGKDASFLICSSRYKGLPCQAEYMDYTQVETVLLPLLVQEGVASSPSDTGASGVAHLRGELADVQSGLKNITDAIESIGLNAVLTDRLNKLTLRESELKTAIENANMVKTKPEFKETLQTLLLQIDDDKIRAELYRLFQDQGLHIVLGKDRLTVNDKYNLERSLERGVYTWTCKGHYSLQMLKAGYIAQQEAVGRDCSHLKRMFYDGGLDTFGVSDAKQEAKETTT